MCKDSTIAIIKDPHRPSKAIGLIPTLSEQVCWEMEVSHEFVAGPVKGEDFEGLFILLSALV